ncbi:MAG: hypothetical protein AB7T06_40380 [Kofleriaceae bacterium]
MFVCSFEALLGERDAIDLLHLEQLRGDRAANLARVLRRELAEVE